MNSKQEQKQEHPPRPGAPRTPDPGGCATDCRQIEVRRNRYFTGRYLTAHDFRLEQSYFLSRHRLHNRLFHGWGIVCGLGIHPHPNPECANRVIIEPGIALDCCGREIILEEPRVVTIWEADAQPCAPSQPDPQPEAHDSLEVAPAAEPAPTGLTREATAYLLVIAYDEEDSEFAPVLYDDNCNDAACGPGQLAANRIRERACLTVVPWEPANRKSYAGCWPTAEPGPRPCVDCDIDPCDEQPGCLDPACDCELGVPLALISPWFQNGGFAIVDESLDFSGRRELQTPAAYLTHVVALNWPHGGRVPLSALRDPGGMNGELRITFDRKLLPGDPDNMATGINGSTFVVEAHRQADVRYELELLHNDGQPPYLAEDGCTAVFKIDDELLEGRQNLGDYLLHVVLRCNFILDCHRRPVDGDHMKGTLPSGNGWPGGTFESWVWIVDDYEPRGGRAAR